MDFLGLFAALIALAVALLVRKAIGSVQLELSSLRTRLARLEGASEGRAAEPPEVPAAAAPTSAQPEVQTPAAASPAEPATTPATSPAAAAGAGAALPPQTTTTLEERLGTRWAVWVGGVSLALGGLLLVRFSIEQGIFGPGVRVALGAVFSLLLIAAGECFRRTEQAPIEAIPAAHIPSVCTAAGTASAFGTVYAAHALYGFIGPAPAFVLLGAIGIATMFAAALHGPALAGLGLAGSLVVPLLVASHSPNPWPVVIYLATVAGSAYALARLRRWLWLAACVVAGVLVWGLALLSGAVAGTSVDWVPALFVHTGVQLALAAAFVAIEPHLGVRDAEATPDWIATSALCVLAILAVLALGAGRLHDHSTLFAVATMAVLALTSWRSTPAASAAGLAGLVALGAIAVWPGLKADPEPRLLAPAIADVLRLPDNVSQFLIFAGVSALAVALLATLRLDRGRALPVATAGLFALAAIVTPLLALVLAYLRVTQFDRSIPFAIFAVVLAAVFYLPAHRFGGLTEAARTPATRIASGAFAAGVAAATTLAFVMVLERGYLTVAFALTALTTAIVAERYRVPLLRGVVAALAFMVLGRLIWDPRVMGEGIGTLPLFNWLLFGYGVPAVAFLASGFVLKREREDVPVRICDALGVLFAALLVFYEIRHALNGGDPFADTSGHVEQGLFALMSIGFAYVLMRLDVARANPVFRYASLAFGVISAAFIVFGLGIVENPLFSGEPVVGVPILSSLLLAYLLPGLAAALLSRASRGMRPEWYVGGAAVLAMLLLFGYVSLEVRHAFQGAVIAYWEPASQPEIWSYSAAWLLLGLAFLAYGIVRGTREPRLASAALIILSAVKVFLYDLMGAGGLWSALSVICLGAVLLGIGRVYQKLIFARPRAPAGTTT